MYGLYGRDQAKPTGKKSENAQLKARNTNELNKIQDEKGQLKNIDNEFVSLKNK